MLSWLLTSIFSKHGSICLLSKHDKNYLLGRHGKICLVSKQRSTSITWYYEFHWCTTLNWPIRSRISCPLIGRFNKLHQWTKHRFLILAVLYSLDIDCAPGRVFASAPIWTMAHRVQHHIAARSPSIEPSMPFKSLIFCRWRVPKMRRGRPQSEAAPHNKQLSPKASAFLPKVMQGQKNVMRQRLQSLKHPNRPCCHSPIVEFLLWNIWI